MRWVILGNSGSGKSTLARFLSEEHGAAHLDLDTVAWEPGQIAVPRAPADAIADVQRFCAAHPSFVVEGCYASLVRAALELEPTLIFLDRPVERCIAHCRARPFEPHKYKTPAEQDERLEFLIDWVRGYPARDGELGRPAHEALFLAYSGPKERRVD